jgi:hypothetical protein
MHLQGFGNYLPTEIWVAPGKENPVPAPKTTSSVSSRKKNLCSAACIFGFNVFFVEFGIYYLCPGVLACPYNLMMYCSADCFLRCLHWRNAHCACLNPSKYIFHSCRSDQVLSYPTQTLKPINVHVYTYLSHSSNNIWVSMKERSSEILIFGAKVLQFDTIF